MVLSAKPPREREAAADHQREAATQLWPQHPRWLRGTEGLAQPNRSPQAQQRLLCPPRSCALAPPAKDSPEPEGRLHLEVQG